MRCAKLFLRCSHRKGLDATPATFWRNNVCRDLKKRRQSSQSIVYQTNGMARKSLRKNDKCRDCTKKGCRSNKQHPSSEFGMINLYLYTKASTALRKVFLSAVFSVSLYFLSVSGAGSSLANTNRCATQSQKDHIWGVLKSFSCLNCFNRKTNPPAEPNQWTFTFTSTSSPEKSFIQISSSFSSMQLASSK